MIVFILLEKKRWIGEGHVVVYFVCKNWVPCDFRIQSRVHRFKIFREEKLTGHRISHSQSKTSEGNRHVPSSARWLQSTGPASGFIPCHRGFLVSVEVPDWLASQDYWGEQNPDLAVGYSYMFFPTSKYVAGINVYMYIDMSL